MMRASLFYLRAAAVVVLPGSVAGLWYGYYVRAVRPAERLEAGLIRAGRALETAAENHAPLLVPDLWAQAQACRGRLLARWKIANERPLITRDLRGLVPAVDSCVLLCESIPEQCGSARDSLRAAARALLQRGKDEISAARREYGALPLGRGAAGLSRSEQDIVAADRAYSRGNYREALDKAAAAYAAAGGWRARCASLLDDYLRDTLQWRAWAEEAIRASRRTGGRAVVIDKAARTCRLYSNGGLVEEFRVALGPYWIGHKRHRGDRRTPEGVYRITAKKGTGQTRYCRALLLDYPNERDRRSYNRRLQTGQTKKGVGIGNLIEIHGDGGKTGDWTDGCVALADSDVKRLYDLVTVGTTVVIVGTVSGRIAFDKLRKL